MPIVPTHTQLPKDWRSLNQVQDYAIWLAAFFNSKVTIFQREGMKTYLVCFTVNEKHHKVEPHEVIWRTYKARAFSIGAPCDPRCLATAVQDACCVTGGKCARLAGVPPSPATSLIDEKYILREWGDGYWKEDVFEWDAKERS